MLCRFHSAPSVTYYGRRVCLQPFFGIANNPQNLRLYPSLLMQNGNCKGVLYTCFLKAKVKETNCKER